MKTVRFEYKCRRCGEISHPISAPEREVLACMLYALANIASISVSSQLTMCELHNCADGGVGVADLLGCTPPAES